jgi:putative methionine-R-sulfoxide reductase with GAF domain
MQLVDQRGISGKDRVRLTLLSLPVSLTTTAASMALGFAAGASQGASKVIFAAAAVVCAVCTGLIAHFRQPKSGGYRQIAARLARATAGAGQPVLIALGQLCQADTQEIATARAEQLRQRVLETARQVCGIKPSDEKRAVLYEFSSSDGSLELRTWVGRDTEPRPEFKIDDVPLGRAVVEFASMKILDRRVDRVNDVRTDPVRGEVNLKHCRYRSFLATPVAIGSHSYGLLSVDCSSPSTFTEMDEGTISLLAGVLAAGLAKLESSVR